MGTQRLTGPELIAVGEEVILRYLYNEPNPEWDYLVSHPSFSEKWLVLFLQRGRHISREQIQQIFSNQEWRKSYRVRLYLMRCRSCPPSISMNLVATLRWVDLMQSLRVPHLTGALRKRIEHEIMEALPRLSLGEKVTLARQATRGLIKHLRMLPDQRVVDVLLLNNYFTYDDALFMANYPRIKPSALAALAKSPKWVSFLEVKLALLRNHDTPNHCLLPMARSLTEFQVRKLLREPKIKLYTKRLLERLVEERYHNKPQQKPKHKRF